MRKGYLALLILAITPLVLPIESGQAAVSTEEANLVSNIARDGMLEVELAKIASKNAKAQKVKDFAEHMMIDHSAANNELKIAAEKDHVELPSELSAAQKKKEGFLQSLTGTGFDDKYMAEMESAHKKAVEAIGLEAKTGTGNLKAWAEKTLPTIKEHKKEAISIDSKLAH